jgi:hypothetical protein
MIELEVYARGLRAESVLLQLRGQMDMLSHMRYKIDVNHDLVYFEIDDPKLVTLRQIDTVFTNIGLEPRFVGQLPDELVEPDSDTKRIAL